MHSYGYTVHSTKLKRNMCIMLLISRTTKTLGHGVLSFNTITNNKTNSKFVQIGQPAIKKVLRYYCAWKPHLKVEITFTVSLTGHIEVS